MQILGAQRQSLRIRLLAGFTFLMWIFVAPNGHVIYLMGHQEEFWRYHNGQWATAMIISVIASSIVGFFSRRWGVMILAFSAMVIMAPLVANASLSGNQSLPDVDWQAQQMYREVWLKELLVAIAGTLICVAFWKLPNEIRKAADSDKPLEVAGLSGHGSPATVVAVIKESTPIPAAIYPARYRQPGPEEI